MKTIIVIPARMASTRFPNKPMAMINKKPMIAHVWEKAKEANLGKVLVACCEKEVFECIQSFGGEAILTDPKIPSGTDRIYAALENDKEFELYDSIINLQGDMPLIDTKSILTVNKIFSQGYDISTLVTSFSSDSEKENKNITKAKVKWIKKNNIGEAIDFYKIRKSNDEDFVYHHVGIYCFSPASLKKFINLNQTTKEKELKLEQMRAIENNITIGVGYVNNVAISVDTIEDLVQLEMQIKKNE